ncbi:MAG: glutamate racemase [Acidobacteriota bacterium]|jgi:glutamate racemase
MKSTAPIGVFDSGVGGLTVVASLRKSYPELDILYFGDTARVPYGNKSPETVLRYSTEITHFLMERDISALVIACNTSSAVARTAIARSLPVPVLGMIEPGAKRAVQATRNGRIGLIGTRATVFSGAYTAAIHAISPDAQVFGAACPLFVPVVEEGWAGTSVAEQIADHYLQPLLEKGIDTLILGCTHYPVLTPVLEKITHGQVRLISSAEAAALELGSSLPGLPAPGTQSTFSPGALSCFVTDSGTHFREVGETILGITLNHIEHVEEERLVIHEK